MVLTALLASVNTVARGIDTPQNETTFSFDIPQQRADKALTLFAEQASLTLVFPFDKVKGMTTNRLLGGYTLQDAIGRLLEGTGLVASFSNQLTLKIALDEEAVMRNRKSFWATMVSLLVGTSSPQAIQAQTGSEGFRLLEEVVVSARRKDEQLTMVPASITAYSSDFLEKQNVRTFVDYATRIPNLTFQYGQGVDLLWSGGRETTVRGVAGSGTTAYYINDTPVPSSVSPQTLNLDRIEVLKGPQGTLYGASSMGGNVRFITQKPSLNENTGALQVQVGSTEDSGTDFDGSVQGNIVLVPDRIALDATLGYSRESGFITRRFPDASGALVEKDGQGRTDNLTGSLTLLAYLTDSLEATVSAMVQTTELDGLPGAYVPLPDYKPESYTVDRDRDVQEYSDDHWSIGSVVLDYSGTGFSVISSTSVFARSIKEKEDTTEGTDLFFENDIGIDLGDPVSFTISDMEEKRFTQEIRLDFNEGTLLPGLSGIVGAFYQYKTQKALVPGIHMQELADAGFEPAYLVDAVLDTKEDNAAIFGEIYYEIVPRLTATLGLRQYWIEQKTEASTDTGFLFGPEGNVNPELRSSQSGLVPKAVLSYEVGDSGNIYASVAKGFRLGGSQLAVPDFCAADLAALGLAEEGLLQYDSDTLWSYEVGAKGRLADGRVSLSTAAFQIDWSDIQQTALLPNCGWPLITNAGEARIRGGEVEITATPFDNVPLSVQMGVGYTDGVLRDPGFLPQAPNSALGQVPEWTGTISGYYETPITEGINFFAAADYSYTDSVAVPDGAGGFHERQPFNLVNGNIGINFGRSKLMVYGKNLLDKRLNFGDQPSAGFERQIMLDDGSYQRLPRAVVSRPRELGVQFTMDL